MTDRESGKYCPIFLLEGGTPRRKRAYTSGWLYLSKVFKASRDLVHAAQGSRRWMILSAAFYNYLSYSPFGIVEPHWHSSPYTSTIADLSETDYTAWLERVQQLLQPMRLFDCRVLILSAESGPRYVPTLLEWLKSQGARPEAPLLGLSEKEALRWLRSESKKNPRYY